jgi:hypothetical protein
LKLTHTKLSPLVQAHLAQLFVEAKWFYYFLVGHEYLFAADAKQLCKRKTIPVKMGEEFVDRELRCLSSQMKQGLPTQIQNSVRGLARLKKRGGKSGG